MSGTTEKKRRPIIYTETLTVQEWIDLIASLTPGEMREFATQVWNEVKEHESRTDLIRIRVDPFL